MNWKRILAASIIFAAVSQMLRIVESMLTLDFYMDPAYFGVWSKVMMPTAGAPPAEFYYTSIAASLIIATIFAAVYAMVKGSLPGKTDVAKGLKYGIILFIMVQVPGLLSMYLLINLPAVLLVYWGISSALISLVGGIIFSKIIK
jgi:hypothetical protein